MDIVNTVGKMISNKGGRDEHGDPYEHDEHLVGIVTTSV